MPHHLYGEDNNLLTLGEVGCINYSPETLGKYSRLFKISSVDSQAPEQPLDPKEFQSLAPWAGSVLRSLS